MGKRGPAPRPTHLKALEGCREDRLNRDEPIPDGTAAIMPPVELPADALSVWNRLVPDLVAKRVMTAWDVDMFAAYCLEVAGYFRAAAEVERSGESTDRPYKGSVVSPAAQVKARCLKDARMLAAAFGLTPGDRAGLKVSDDGGSRSGAAAYIS